MKLNIWKCFPWILLGLVAIGTVIWAKNIQEGVETFQTAATAPPPKTFQEYLDKQDDEDIATLINDVMYPKEKDAFQMVFPRTFSIFALAEAGGNAALARNNLMLNYTELQDKFATTFQVPDDNARWAANPKQETCAQLGQLRTILNQKVALARQRVQDVSGSQLVAMNMKDENMRLQKEYAAACSKNMTPECIKLASQDTTVFPLLDDYDQVNEKAFEDEDDIKDILGTIKTAFSLLGCDTTTTTMDYGAEKDIGFVDTESLREKLGELSPYYISPANLQYISSTLIGADEISGLFQTVDKNAGSMETAVSATKTLVGPYIPSSS